jgi:hypothetical protein
LIKGFTASAWLPKLLNLPTSGDEWLLPAGCDVTIQEQRWGDNEKKLDPPVALLSWLIRHPREPQSGGLSSNPAKAQKRRELIDGDERRTMQGLALLRNNPTGADWHIFEGPTQPDVFIQTPSLLVVIEGKRTELGPTTFTKWMPGRHQMLRHLDCAWEIRGQRHVRGFFIVEGEGNDEAVPRKWPDFASDTVSPSALATSLPHRGPEEQAGIGLAAGWSLSSTARKTPRFRSKKSTRCRWTNSRRR